MTLFFLMMSESIDCLFDCLTRDGPDEFSMYPVLFDKGVSFVLRLSFGLLVDEF